MAEAQLSYCAAEVRRRDPERFLTALFAPRGRREDLFTLYAFNLELAKTREVVSEPILGRIRLQWWREAIAGIYAEAPQHQAVAQALAGLVLSRGLGRAHFERLIEAREQELEEMPSQTLALLEGFAANSSAPLVALALEALGVRGEAATVAAEACGTGWALTGLLRAVPFHARQRRLYLPADLLAEAGLAPDELFERGGARGLPPVVRRIAARAHAHLAMLAPLRRQLPRAAVPALLPAVLARSHLAHLRRAGYDPFALKDQPKRPLAVLRVTAAAFSGRF
ncbi:MAG TPA: phytoene/squalene synthase family protein [Alphaproteobacteria bacterium]|nr:phytoene/squalene synthase family protein [Alphaproteobacteria bacterium]